MNALPLTLLDRPPTEPGWYVMRDHLDEQPLRVVRLYAATGGGLSFHPGFGRLAVKPDGTAWPEHTWVARLSGLESIPVLPRSGGGKP